MEIHILSTFNHFLYYQLPGTGKDQSVLFLRVQLCLWVCGIFFAKITHENEVTQYSFQLFDLLHLA